MTVTKNLSASAVAIDTGGKRVIRGIASTPDVDRVGDIVDPLGATFRNPVPLLHQHDHRRPVGTVTFRTPTARGIEFEATLASDLPAGELRDRVDTAWQEVEAGLVRSVSIGFRPIKTTPIATGTRFDSYELIELSLVTVPANAGAVITGVGEKSAERRVRHDVPLVRVSPRAGQPVRLGGGRAVKIADNPRGPRKPGIVRL